MRTAREEKSGSTAAFGERRPNRRRVEIEAVVAHEEVQAGRVATTHLEAIDGREGLVHREVDGHGRRPGTGTGQRLDAVGRPQPVTTQAPHPVLERDEPGVEHLEGLAGQGGTFAIEPTLERQDLFLESEGLVLDRRPQGGGAEHRSHARQAP